MPHYTLARGIQSWYGSVDQGKNKTWTDRQPLTPPLRHETRNITQPPGDYLNCTTGAVESLYPGGDDTDFPRSILINQDQRKTGDWVSATPEIIRGSGYLRLSNMHIKKKKKKRPPRNIRLHISIVATSPPAAFPHNPTFSLS